MSKKDVMAVVNLGYSNKVMLPIDEAHKIQAILARHAIRYDTIWRSSRSIHYITDFEVPEVVVVNRPADYDARGIDPVKVRDWVTSITTHDGGVNAEIMDPHVFAKLTTEEC